MENNKEQEMESTVEDIDALKVKISEIQNQIKLNPNSYDSHVELISLLSSLYSVFKTDKIKSDVDSDEQKSQQIALSFKKLRNARQNMSSIYPLTIELWIKWIDDETNAPTYLISHEIIEDIFNKATVDYLSVDIWTVYTNYLISRFEDTSANVTVDFIRDVFEKAVTNCGLHYRDGHKIWECYQLFELKLLVEIEKQGGENNNEENIRCLKKKFADLVKLYRRALSVPLARHNEVLDNFHKVVDPHIEILKSLSLEVSSLINIDELNNISQKTLNNIESNSIRINEDYLEQCQHSFEAYQSYIAFELDSGVNDPARIQCIFERAIVYHCLKPNIWIDYIDFLNNVIKLPDLVINVCTRALRNITWDSRVFLKYTLILEQQSHDVGNIRETFESGLEKYSNNGYNYCNIFISYLSFEKRLCKSDEAIQKMKPRAYQLIQRAIHQLNEMEDADKCIVEFVLFWVDVERFWFNNEDKAADIWKYMASKYKSLWFQAITFARTVGNKTLVNDIFDINLLQFPDEIENFCQSWLNNEILFGNVNLINQLTKKINIYLPSHIQGRQTKETEGILSKIEHKNKYLRSWLRNAEEKLFSLKNTENSRSDSTAQKSKYIHNNSKNVMNRTEKKEIDTVANNIHKSTNDDVMKPDRKRKHESEANTNRSMIGPELPSFLSGSTNKDDNDADDYTSVPKKTKQNENITESSSNTVYVSNLHPATKESDLETIFGRIGTVLKLTLNKQKGGKSFAFVTYSTMEEALKALELEHTPLLNRPLYVSKFSKQTNHKEKTISSGASLYSQSQEKNKLYVSNLNKLTTQIDLEKLFNQYGDMISLRLIKKNNKLGSTVAFAYVEYATEEAASRYRKAINNTIVKGQTINVEFSNPSIANHGRQNVSGTFDKTKRTSDGNKESIHSSVSQKAPNDDVFVKPKPVSLGGLIPTQARNRNQQVNKEQSTKKGPAMRINFVPASNNDQSNSEVKHETVTEDQSSATTVSSARKTNDEFRKMFFKS